MDFKALQDTIGYQFQNEALLETALTHASAGGEKNDCNYERLEFLGDRVLGLVMAELLYKRYPTEAEGDLAKRHAALVQGKTLAQVAKNINLSAAMIISETERASGGAENENMLADIMEALLGAVYLEGDIDPCRKIISRLWDGLLDVMVEPPQDPKTALQEWAQGQGLPLPHYEITNRTGPDHAPTFTITVSVDGYDKTTSASAPSRRAAEKIAAKIFLEKNGQ